MRIESTIMSSLLISEDYTRKVLPHLDKDYFAERADALIYDEISKYFLQYNELPSKETLLIQVTEKSGVNVADVEDAFTRINGFQTEPKKLDWLLDKTEAFCRDRALYNAIMKSITIIDGKEKNIDRGSIPEILQKALGISFNTAVGHSYLDDAAERYDFYTRLDSKIRMDLDIFNKITHGGLSKKSLTILLAIQGGGKSLVLSHMAAGFLREGYNVLYISLEMQEQKIAERIDANLMGVDLDKLSLLGKDIFCTKIANIAAKTQGRLFVKEYPNGSAHTGHFRGLVEELKTKQNFKPDVILVDYLGICASSRMKLGGSVNSYAYLKSISEELRALAVELELPIVTAGQVNRGAYGASDIDLSDTSECLAKDTQVFNTKTNAIMRIDELNPGDTILGSIGSVTVMKVHHSKRKKKIIIKTKSGKTIECSADHKFPTPKGRLSVNTGLEIGDLLNSRFNWPTKN